MDCTHKLVLPPPTALGLSLIFSQGCRGLFGDQASLRLKQNTRTTEDDTLMGTDVGSNVICRLKELGYRCGKVSSTLTCVHHNANCGHQIPLMRPDGVKQPFLKYCQLH